MTMRVTVLGLLLMALACVGCARGYTRLFQPASPNQVYVDKYRVFPRITAFRNATKTVAEQVGNGFWTSLRVYDTTRQVGDLSDSAYVAQRDSLALDFLRTALGCLVVDSLVLEQSPDGERLTFLPDSVTHTPRDVNYFSYNFGQITIPRSVSAIRAVFFYRLYAVDGGFVRGDSLAIPMTRLELDQMLITDALESDSASGFRGN